MWQKTAEERLYRWLKRKTTPIGVWRQTTLEELAVKVHCSKSQVSRSLPKAVARLEGISLDAAEKLVEDVMSVRRGHLIDFEIRIILQLRDREKPVTYPRLSKIFGVSTKQIADVCKKFQLSAVECGTGGDYSCSDEELIPEAFRDRIPQIIENAGIRRERSQKHKNLQQPKTEPFEDFYRRLYPEGSKRWYG